MGIRCASNFTPFLQNGTGGPRKRILLVSATRAQSIDAKTHERGTRYATVFTRLFHHKGAPESAPAGGGAFGVQ